MLHHLTSKVLSLTSFFTPRNCGSRWTWTQLCQQHDPQLRSVTVTYEAGLLMPVSTPNHTPPTTLDVQSDPSFSPLFSAGLPTLPRFPHPHVLLLVVPPYLE